MKNVTIILILPLAYFQFKSQSSYFGFKGGLNRPVLTGTADMSPYYKSGPVTEKFCIPPELVYSGQGGARVEYYSSTSLSIVVGETKTYLSFVSLPVVAKVYVGKVVDPQLGFLLSATELIWKSIKIRET